ncbi:C-type lectin domain family 4 member A isoform X3 [Carlito syrichta]|uniref:C-type lectin domain family 4 member A isoform X3 n=1 Tax=Carlito syrichta TaxID=1868482 RepID=A0A1U7UAG1_CARSF|nr:C-type lectin domain family 4 member A isoform X3 [Carlito syrichta]
MASEITYAEVRFKNGSKSLGTNSDSPAVFFQKHSQFIEGKKTTKESIHTKLVCEKENVTTEEKVWSCCPVNWKPFSSSCYFISTAPKPWSESEKNCSRMEAHLLVINTEGEQDFIIQHLKTNFAYFVGLSDPEGQNHWQWVDQTPYNKNLTFWHRWEPSNSAERCVMLNYRGVPRKWGWNDIRCSDEQGSVCEMMKIHL